MTNQVTPKPCIMVVDDDAFYRKAVVSYLQLEGFEIIEAESGADALGQFEPGKFDVLLLDLMMAGMGGIDTLTQLRALHPEDDTPIIVISGRHDKVSLIDAIHAGAIEYLTKPIDPTELTIRLRTLLRLRTLQKQLVERERMMSQQQVLDNLTTTVAHHINNAATSILLMCEAHKLPDEEEDWPYFISVVEQQTRRIVRVVAALQRVKSLKDRTTSYVGDIEMIDIDRELQETIQMLEHPDSNNSAPGDPS